MSYQAGISTLGETFGYGVETVAGQKPAVFYQLHRINEIGEVSITQEQIDASALEDSITRNVPGRGSVSDWSVTFNATDETIEEWSDVIEAYQTLTGGKRMWFQTITPGLTKADFVVAAPPSAIAKAQDSQNGLKTISMSMVVDEYVGYDTKVAFSEKE